MTAGFAAGAGDALGDDPGFDFKLSAAVLTGDLHHMGWRLRRFLSSVGCFILLPVRPKRDCIPAGLAARCADIGWNLARVHGIDFFAFRTANVHGRLPDSWAWMLRIYGK